MMRACPLYSICVALGLSVAAIGQERLPGFGVPDGGNRLPGFGGPWESPLKVTKKDLADAASAIRKVDTNKDGVMSREELRNSRYRKYEERRFRFDADRNHQLTVSELADYYAKIRVDKEAQKSKESKDKEEKERAAANLVVTEIQAVSPNVISWAGSGDVNSGVINSRVINSGNFVVHVADGQSKPLRLSQMAFITQRDGGFVVISLQGGVQAAQEVIRHYDKNGNGVLDRYEWQRIEGHINLADTDHDGTVNLQELAGWLEKQNAGQPSSSSANWFTERDSDHDGQVSMSEFASEWTDARLAEFNRYDRNQDGIITADESVSLETMHGKEFASGPAVVIEPGMGASSPIQVNEDFAIADINVRLAISHTGPEQLAAFLVSPSGRRVELFTGVGKKWKDSSFGNAVFDDDAKTSITAAIPPFCGPLKPEGADSGEKSGLTSYTGESSRGEWRLFIQADRSDRAGLLDSWSLVLVPQH